MHLASSFAIRLIKIGLSRPTAKSNDGRTLERFRPFVEAGSPAHHGNYNATLRSMLKTKLLRAYHKGGILQVPPGLWLMQNDLNSWIIMRPRITELLPAHCPREERKFADGGVRYIPVLFVRHRQSIWPLPLPRREPHTKG